MVKLHQLRALMSVAEAGSIQEAARRTGVSQPALSKAIRELERGLGAEVLVRNTRGVSLTGYGDLTIKRALAVQREIEKLDEEIRSLKTEIGGRLTIGFTPLAAGAALAESVGEFRKRQPAVELRLLELRPNAIVEGMRQGRFDFGMLTLYGASRVAGFETQVVESYGSTLVAGGRRASADVSIEELLDEEWLDAEGGDGSDGYIQALTRRLDLPAPARILPCSSIHLCAMLAAELGAICPMIEAATAFFQPEIEVGKLTQLRLDAPLPRMNVVLAYPDAALLSPAAREMTKIMRAMGDLDLLEPEAP